MRPLQTASTQGNGSQNTKQKKPRIMKTFWNRIVAMVAQFCKFAERHWIVHLKTWILEYGSYTSIQLFKKISWLQNSMLSMNLIFAWNTHTHAVQGRVYSPVIIKVTLGSDGGGFPLFWISCNKLLESGKNTTISNTPNTLWVNYLESTEYQHQTFHGHLNLGPDSFV